MGSGGHQTEARQGFRQYLSKFLPDVIEWCREASDKGPPLFALKVILIILDGFRTVDPLFIVNLTASRGNFCSLAESVQLRAVISQGECPRRKRELPSWIREIKIFHILFIEGKRAETRTLLYSPCSDSL